MSRAVRFALAAGAVTLLVILVGMGMVDAPGRRGVYVGATVGFASQVALFWGLTELFPRKPLVVYGVGMMGRFVVLAITAFSLVPGAGLPPVPTLFSLVATLFATTVVEPILLAADTRNER